MNITEYKRQRSPHQPVGRWIRVEKRLAIYLRDAFLCVLCERSLLNVNPFDITLDHFVPRAKGGSNSETNVFTCCRGCNSSRQTAQPSRADAARIRATLSVELAPFRQLATTLRTIATAKRCIKRTHVCECTACGFTTPVRGLKLCPSCKAAS